MFEEDDVRGHAFIFRFKIPSDLRNWKNRYWYIKKYHQDLCPKRLNKGTKIVYNQKNIHLWDTSIVIYDSESYIKKTEKQAEGQAIDNVIKLMEGLARKLKLNLPSMKFTVNRKHFGLIKNALAVYHKKRGLKQYIHDDQGYWLRIDFSQLDKTSPLHVPELEIHSSKGHNATETAEQARLWWNSFKSHDFKVDANFILTGFHHLTNSQFMSSSNIKKHLNVLDQIQAKIEEFGDRVEDLNKVLKYLLKNIKD